jgi:hypothetical protein
VESSPRALCSSQKKSVLEPVAVAMDSIERGYSQVVGNPALLWREAKGFPGIPTALSTAEDQEPSRPHQPLASKANKNNEFPQADRKGRL